MNILLHLGEKEAEPIESSTCNFDIHSLWSFGSLDLLDVNHPFPEREYKGT